MGKIGRLLIEATVMKSDGFVFRKVHVFFRFYKNKIKYRYIVDLVINVSFKENKEKTFKNVDFFP